MPCKVCDGIGRAPVGPHILPNGREIKFLYCEECDAGETLYKEAYFPEKIKTLWVEEWLAATTSMKQ